MRTALETDTIPADTKEAGSADVRFIGRIDRGIYRCVTPDITTDEVVITATQTLHIQEHHPQDLEAFEKYALGMLENPEALFQGNLPNTAVVVNEMDGKYFKLILRLHTSQDPDGYENSVITFQHVRQKEYRRMLRAWDVLYRRE